MPGYIKDYRDELNSDIWLMPPLYHRVWQYLKYNVNHTEKKIPMDTGDFFTVKPGQRLTSIRQIAQGVGYYEGLKWKEPNPKTISTILKWMEKQQMINIERGKGNRQYTLVTLINWDLYQSKNEEGNSKETVNGEGKKQSADINKNDKECIKNDKEINKRHKYEICDMQLAELLYSKILENNPEHKKPNLEKWADDIRKMRTIDKRTEEQIKFLIEWSQQHDFWQTNILSAAKLRDRYDQLVIQVKVERKKKFNNVVQLNQGKAARDF